MGSARAFLSRAALLGRNVAQRPHGVSRDVLTERVINLGLAKVVPQKIDLLAFFSRYFQKRLRAIKRLRIADDSIGDIFESHGGRVSLRPRRAAGESLYRES